MIQIANFKFDMLNSKSFAFQHIYTKPYITYNKELTITFPAGEKLMFKEAESTFPTQLALGNNGDLDSEVLADLNEYGYDLESGVAVVNIDIETLRKATAFNPSMFTKDGEEVDFLFDGFPDGVYKAEFSYQEMPETDKTSLDLTNLSEPISGVRYSIKMCLSLACRASKIEEYFEKSCKIPTDCRRKKELENLINRMRILELGALWDFREKDYEEASKKIEAMRVLCVTGKCNYKVGC